MSFSRGRVEPVKVSPQPGRYKAPIRITMESPTSGAEIFFTTDGTVPVRNSDREHGYRCEHYKPFSGFELTEDGIVVLTIQAHKAGLVSTEIFQCKYEIYGGRQRTTTSLPDMMIERRFHAMEQLDPPMQVRQARKRNKEMRCYLVDTFPKSILREKIHSGEPLTLFKLRYDANSAAGRNYQYRRVVAPNMNIEMPQLPSSKSKSIAAPAIALSVDGRRSTTPVLYNAPRSYTPGTGTDALSPTDGRQPAPALPPIADHTTTALAIFEHRTGIDLVSAITDYGDDKEEVGDMLRYQNNNTDIFNVEQLRVGSVSPATSRATDRVMAITEDVASADRKFLASLWFAEAGCHDPCFRAFLNLVTVRGLQEKFSSVRPNELVTVFDILPLTGGAVDQRELTRLLRAFEANPMQQPPTYCPMKLIQVSKYVINTFYDTKDAFIGFVSDLWHDEHIQTGVEPTVSHLSLQTVITTYSRSPQADSAVTAVAHHLAQKDGGLLWTEEGTTGGKAWRSISTCRTPALQFIALLRDRCPALDKRLLAMGDPSNSVYYKVLPKP